MTDDKTRHFTGSSFEDRLMARFDAMEQRFDAVEERMRALEMRFEDRLRQTRPIWEKALAEILATREEVKALHTKLDILNDDVLNVRARQRESDIRLKEFESLLRQGGIS
jgi:hypothetical protein